MDKAEKNNLPKRDGGDIMLLKMRWVARHIQHGRIQVHGEDLGKVPDFQVVNGVIKQGDIHIVPFERCRANGE